MSRISKPTRDQQIDRVLAALDLQPLYLRLVASAHCDEHAAHRALELIDLAGRIVDFTTNHDNGGTYAT